MKDVIDFPCSNTFLGYYKEIGLIKDYQDQVVKDAVIYVAARQSYRQNVSMYFENLQEQELFMKVLRRIENDLNSVLLLEDENKRLKYELDNLKAFVQRRLDEGKNRAK